MKKILACAACLLSLVAANSAFAVTSTTNVINLAAGTIDASNPQLPVQLSANVVMQYNPSTSGGAAGTWYNISTFHNKGTRTYSSTSNDSKIYYQETTAGNILGLPASASSSDVSDWLTL